MFSQNFPKMKVCGYDEPSLLEIGTSRGLDETVRKISCLDRTKLVPRFTGHHQHRRLWHNVRENAFRVVVGQVRRPHQGPAPRPPEPPCPTAFHSRLSILPPQASHFLLLPLVIVSWHVYEKNNIKREETNVSCSVTAAVAGRGQQGRQSSVAPRTCRGGMGARGIDAQHRVCDAD